MRRHVITEDGFLGSIAGVDDREGSVTLDLPGVGRRGGVQPHQLQSLVPGRGHVPCTQDSRVPKRYAAAHSGLVSNPTGVQVCRERGSSSSSSSSSSDDSVSAQALAICQRRQVQQFLLEAGAVDALVNAFLEFADPVSVLSQADCVKDLAGALKQRRVTERIAEVVCAAARRGTLRVDTHAMLPERDARSPCCFPCASLCRHSVYQADPPPHAPPHTHSAPEESRRQCATVRWTEREIPGLGGGGVWRRCRI